MAAKSFPQQVCDLYNAANPDLPHPLTPSDVQFGSRAAAPEGDTSGKNFMMDISAKEDSQYFTGGIRLSYNRLKLNLGIATALETDFNWADDNDLLTALNLKLQQIFPGDMFTVEDDLDYGMLTFSHEANETEPEKTDYIYTLSPNHMKFFADGSILRIVVAPVVSKVDLSTANGELDAFSA